MFLWGLAADKDTASVEEFDLNVANRNETGDTTMNPS